MTTQNRSEYPKVKSKPRKIGLVLSGGGLKAAAYHCGVCQALKEFGYSFRAGSRSEYSEVSPIQMAPTQMDSQGSSTSNLSSQKENLTIQIFVGSSAGAMVAGLLTSGYSPEDLIRAFIRDYSSPEHWGSGLKLDPLSPRKIFSLNKRGLIRDLPRSIIKGASFRNNIEGWFKDALAFSGIFTTRRIEEYLRTKALTVNRFQDLSPELFIVTSELNRSQKIIFGAEDRINLELGYKYQSFASISQAISASISMPPIFAPFSIQDTEGEEIWLYDGEIRDTLSLHVATDHNADLVICSYAIKPYEMNSEKGSLHKYGSATIANQALYQIIQQKIDRSLEHTQNLQQAYQDVLLLLDREGILSEKLRSSIYNIFQNRGAALGTEVLMIHPESSEMFFYDHFPFSTKVLEKIVQHGKTDATRVLSSYGQVKAN